MASERGSEITTPGGGDALDARGLTCPLPVLKARKRLMGLAPGERLLVLATDPKAPEDFRAFCAEAGHALLESGEEAGAFRFLIGRR
jgi:tRNA 2-thiouridine synthesizing protein A